MIERGPARLRFFTQGLGDPTELEWFQDSAHEAWPLLKLQIEWSEPTAKASTIIHEGHFESPLEFLPTRARAGRVRLIEPREGAERCVLLLAAWNDHTFTTRTAIGTRLAASGIASLLLENPYYGERRPAPEPWQSIQTVVDMARMGRAAIEEGRALLQYGQDELGFQMGVSGYSMGGAHAAYVAATSPIPVATAPLAPSHSPAAVFKDSALAAGVGLATESERRRFNAYLDSVSVLNFAAPPHTGAAVLVAAVDDGYVPYESAQAIHRHWPGSKLIKTGGGHASLLLMRKPILVRAIRDSFDRLYESE